MSAGKLLWGYHPATKTWIPLQVDENGKVIVDMSAISLGDLGDVTIAGLADGHFLSYSAGLGYWQNRLLAEGDIPAAIARDAEVIDQIDTHAGLTTGVHGVGIHGILDVTRSALTYYVDQATGDDGNPGTSASPKATILGALNALPVVIAHEATICVRPGNYPENNTFLTFARFNTLDFIIIKSVNSSDEDMYDNGKATGGGNNYLDDSGKSWSADQFNGAYIWIYAGTGRGQVRQISDTTATRITVTANWTTNPNNTSYYAIGGGATLTGTDSRHVYVQTKKVMLYGFRHTGATSEDIYASRYAACYVYNNYFASSNMGYRAEYFIYAYAYYNYSAASLYGFQVTIFSHAFLRANVIDGANIGIRIIRGAIVSMLSGTSLLNYIANCTTGIFIDESAGCILASFQVYVANGTDIDPAVSTTVPRWWT